MSSVGNSDSSASSTAQQNDVVRKNREEYRGEEAEMVKKQSKEIRRLNEEHYAEIEKLKNEHQAQIEDLRQDAHKEINARDHKYQQEIEDVRGLYRKQLQTQADDSQRQTQALRKSTVLSADQEKNSNEQRFAKLTSDYGQQLDVREKGYEQSLQNARGEQQP